MTDTVAVFEKQAHRAAVAMGTADVVAFLQDVFGQKLVAYMAGRTDPGQVSGWANGTHRPRREAEDRLREAYRVFHLLQSQESPHTVRAWFVGLNPQLDDESPATVIRAGRFKDVVIAARAFLAGG